MISIFTTKPKLSEWNLIETCPIDEVVLIACDSYDCGWIFDTAWKTKEGKFMSSASVYGDVLEIHLPPSHWMPLPEFPKEQS